MSWDAYFDGHAWNYTHNTNRMIAAALEDHAGIETPQCGGSLGPVIGPAWWKRLENAGAAEGQAYLGLLITCLEADPAKYRAMNPENGWGDYDRLLVVLREMRDASVVHPDPRWSVSG